MNDRPYLFLGWATLILIIGAFLCIAAGFGVLALPLVLLWLYVFARFA